MNPISTAPHDKRVLVWSGQEWYVAHWVQHPATGDEAWLIAVWAAWESASAAILVAAAASYDDFHMAAINAAASINSAHISGAGKSKIEQLFLSHLGYIQVCRELVKKGLRTARVKW